MILTGFGESNGFQMFIHRFLYMYFGYFFLPKWNFCDKITP